MNDGEPLLDLRGVRVQYGNFLAVDEFNLTLHGGELLGLIGPNGAGKTTILRAAAGLQPISTGSIQVVGQDVFRHPTQVGRHLGLTPDTPSVYSTLTVARFLHFIGECYGIRRATRNERIDYWLERLWLKDKRSVKVNALSRGMKQRLAVARTLISDPRVILMDEPAAGLDPAGRVYFRRLLAGLRDSGKAIIVSSHILADLAEYCTHIGIMGRGKLVRCGTVAQVAGDADRDRCLYRVTFTHTIGDAEHRAATVGGLSDLKVDGDSMTFECARDRAAAAAVLRRLLDAGLPVAEFRRLEPDLEQAYLRSGIEEVD